MERSELRVGRGLRAPANGGTEGCHVFDEPDDRLPQGIMSYGKVRDLWDAEG